MFTQSKFSPANFLPTTGQVSGHEFTRAVQPKKNLGFSLRRKTPQGLKARLLLPHTARLSRALTLVSLEEAKKAFFAFPNHQISRSRAITRSPISVISENQW